MQTSADKIEILSVNLLDKNRPLVEELKRLARSLSLEFGWHYLLDLTWIISQIGLAPPYPPHLWGEKGGLLESAQSNNQRSRIMDAGAGTGILQWYLAQQGAEVISVDRLDRAALPLRFRRRFRVQGLRMQDLLPDSQTLRRQWASDVPLKNKITQSARDLLDLFRSLSLSKESLSEGGLPKGKVILYHQDLKNLVDIADNSLDAIVAVSALEHNSPQGLQEVVAEMMRVLKPGGILAATLCAARDQDTWHAPSSGWCYTDASLRRLFDLEVNATSNYDHYDELFTALYNCAELRDNLANFYSRSGDNGMPWGKWDPQYQPVGVVKVKL